MQHRILNAGEFSNLCDRLSGGDTIALANHRSLLNLSVTGEKCAVINFQRVSPLVKRIRSERDSAGGDGVYRRADGKIQIATGMGAGAVTSSRSKRAHPLSPIDSRQLLERKEELIVAGRDNGGLVTGDGGVSVSSPSSTVIARPGSLAYPNNAIRHC